MMTIDELLEQRRTAAREVGTLAAEVESLDEVRRIAFSREVTASKESVAKAEHAARASDIYVKSCDDLHNARLKLGEAKAQADYLEKRIEVWRTRSANARQQRSQ